MLEFLKKMVIRSGVDRPRFQMGWSVAVLRIRVIVLSKRIGLKIKTLVIY